MGGSSSKTDQLESALSAAARPTYRHQDIDLARVLVFTDLEPQATEQWGGAVQRFLGSLTSSAEPEWRLVPGRQCDTIGEVLAIVPVVLGLPDGEVGEHAALALAAQGVDVVHAEGRRLAAVRGAVHHRVAPAAPPTTAGSTSVSQ